MPPQAQTEVEALVARLSANDAKTKFGAAKALVELSAKHPEELYSQFDCLRR